MYNIYTSFGNNLSRITSKWAASNWKTLNILSIALLLLAGISAQAQTATCSGATLLTAVNAATCTPGTTFNISTNTTGTAYATCNTGRADATNGWGSFVANSTVASISYTSTRDAMIFAYSGTCGGTLTQIGCVNAVGTNATETLNLTGLTAGTTYFVRIVRYNSTNSMNGTICVASPINTITTGTITGSPFCGGSTVTVPFTSVGIFTGNTYTAQLSNAAGSFASPVTIGTLVSNLNAGTINATLPTAASGTGYRIRVISSNPATIGTDNGSNLTINPLPQGSIIGNTICGTGTGQLTFTASSGTGLFTIVYNDGTSNITKNNVSSGVAFNATPAPSSTTNYSLVSITDNNGCVRTSGFTGGSATITISTTPTITSSATAADICSGTIAQNSTLDYTLTTGTPTQNAITWDAAALSAGLVNLGNTAITASPLNIPIEANVAAGTYTGTVTVTNAAGCVSSGNTFTVLINESPSITSSATAVTKCFSSGDQSCVISYSASTGSPTQYSVVWDAAGLAAGLSNATNKTFIGSPLYFSMGAGIPGGVYNGTISVINGNGCSSVPNAFTQTIIALPTITTDPTAAQRCFNTSAQNSTLAYSASTGSPTLYRVLWDAAAHTAGLTDLALTSLPASPMNIPIAAGVAAGTYNGYIRVMGSSGCQSANDNPFTLTIISATGPVMTSASTASICSGSTVSIPLTSDIPSTFTWIATDNVNVTGESTTLQSTSTLSNTLNLTSGSSQAVNYTVTPISSGGCIGASQTVVVTVNGLPTITAAATTASRCFSATAQTTTLSYSATTNSPTRYAITWNAAALSAGLINVSNAVLPATQITISIPAGVAGGTYTGSLTVTNAAGCTSSANAFTLIISAAPSITTQPTNQTVCSGSSISFSIAASGTGLTYQWRKGTTNICNCASYSGANTATLTINPASAIHAAGNYNCVVTKTGCSGVISNYVTLTVNAAVVAPTAQPKDLVFPTVGITSLLASFTPSADATKYLVIRTTTNVAPTNPTNGTTYTVGTSALTGYVEYTGSGTNFTSNGLTPGTTYYYWVYGYNTSTCGTSPVYLTLDPLTGEATTATTVSCGTVTTLYWGGAGSGLTGATTGTDFNDPVNWSTSNTTYIASPASPTQCNNASMALRNAAIITLSSSAEVYNLTFTIAGNDRVARLSTEGNMLSVYANAVVDVVSGNSGTRIYIGENSSAAGIIDFKANFRLGQNNFASNIPRSYIIGNIDSKIIFRGDVLFGRTASFILPGGGSYPPPNPVAVPGTGTTPGTIEFDGEGLQQVLWNNNVYYDCFYNIVIGNQNRPYVKHVTGSYTPDNILNDFTINDGCTVDLGTSQWIREQQGGTFTMNGSARLILGNNLSVRSTPNTGIRVPGSNFPGGFSTMDISPNSTIEYNGGIGITQTVYGTPSIGTLTYGNLVLSNTDGSGTANKISTSVINAAGMVTISDKTTLTLGAGLVSEGETFVENGGRLNCSTNIVSGNGSFNLLTGGTLSMGSTAGITASGATGNIQTEGRNFATDANYIYTATAAQATGNGLPTTVNDLSIINAAGVTMFAASTEYTVAGTLNLTSGALAINGNTLTINNLLRSSGTLTGSSTSSVGITGTDAPLFFTSGGRILKNLSLFTNASADLETSLDITAGSSAGSLSVGSGSTLNTFNNLTLKSDANGTARVAEVPVDGSGNALGTVTGNVQIERFIPAKRGWRMLALPVQSAGAPTINDALQEGVVNSDLVYANNQNPNPGFGIHISGSSASLGFDPTPLNNPSMLTFTRATGAWSGIANTLSTTVRDYEGFMVFVRGNRSTNVNFNTSAATSTTVLRVLGNLRMGRQTINIAGGTGTYSVIGNPFASTIDIRNVSTSGPVNSSNYVMWDPRLTGTFGVGAYQYFTQLGGPGSDYTVFPGGGSYGAAGSVNNTVQAGQAFMMQNTGAGSVIINENTKVSSSTSAVFRPMPNNTIGKISTLLYTVESDNSTNLVDGALMLYGNNFSDDVDLEDAKKLFNNSENFGINKTAVIYQIEKRQTINETDTILYNIRTMKARNYQLVVDLQQIETTGLTAYLKDKFTNTEVTLNPSVSNVYPFSVTADAASKTQDRFRIYFKQMNVLPVTFTSLNAHRKNKVIHVEWKVEKEINISNYEVEKSTDGVRFSKQQSVTNVTNNNSSNTYQWTDEYPQAGLNYFRIKSIDMDGRSKYTGIAKVFFGNQSAGIAVYPNPVTDGKINIYFTEQQAGEYTARLFNSNGQLLKSTRLQQAGNTGNAIIEMDNSIPHGNYILEIVKPDNTSENIKIIY